MSAKKPSDEASVAHPARKPKPPPAPQSQAPADVLTLKNGTKENARIALCVGGGASDIVGKTPWKIVELEPNKSTTVQASKPFSVSVDWQPHDVKSGAGAVVEATAKGDAVRIAERPAGDKGAIERSLVVSPKGVADRVLVAYQPLIDVQVSLKDGDGATLSGPVSLQAPTIAFDVTAYQIAVVTQSAEVGEPLTQDQVVPYAFHMSGGQTALLTGPFKDENQSRHYVFDVSRTR